MFFSNRRADLSTPTRGRGGGGGAGGGGGGRTHTARRPRHKSHSALDQCGLSFCFSGKSLGIVKLLAFDAGISDFMSNEIKFFFLKKSCIIAVGGLIFTGQ